MVGLQALADVAQLVERRLPKPRKPRFLAVCADRYRQSSDWEVPACERFLPLFATGHGFSCPGRRGVFMALGGT